MVIADDNTNLQTSDQPTSLLARRASEPSLVIIGLDGTTSPLVIEFRGPSRSGPVYRPVQEYPKSGTPSQESSQDLVDHLLTPLFQSTVTGTAGSALLDWVPLIRRGSTPRPMSRLVRHTAAEVLREVGQPQVVNLGTEERPWVHIEAPIRRQFTVTIVARKKGEYRAGYRFPGDS